MLSSMERRSRSSQVRVRFESAGRVRSWGRRFLVVWRPPPATGFGCAGRRGAMVPHARARPVPREPRATLPAVTARSEVPCLLPVVVGTSRTAGPRSRVGIRRSLSRRRLIAYLVRADLRRPAPTRCWATSGGSSTRCSRCSSTVLFVGVILGRGQHRGLPAVHLRGDPALEVVRVDGQRRRRPVVSQERLIKQIYFPKLVLPVATASAGVVSFAFGLIPLFAIMVLFYPDRLTPWLLLIPVVALVQLVFSMAFGDLRVGDQRLLPRRRQPVAPPAPVLVLPVAGPVRRRQVERSLTKRQPDPRRHLVQLNPWTLHVRRLPRPHLLRPGAGVGGRWPSCWSSSVFLTLGAILFFKRVEPSFAKVL